MSITSSQFVDGQIDQADIVELEQTLIAQGRDIARRSGARETEPEVVERLVAMADDAAAKLSAAKYDPATNAADELLEDRFQRARGDIVAAQQHVDYARADWRDSMRELAALGDKPKVPGFPWLLAFVGTLAIGLTIAPTFHDLLVAALVPGRLLALVLSFAASALVAALLVGGILGRSEKAGFWEGIAWTGLGVLFGFALFVMRWSVSGNGGGWLLSLGLALLEAVFVLLVERLGASRARRAEQLREEHRAYEAAERQLEVAKVYLEDREAALAKTEQVIEQHRELVRAREHAVRANALLRNAARSAIHAGYEAGLAENRGHVHDFAVKRPTARSVLGRATEGED